MATASRRHGLITDENRRWWTLGAMCFALFMLMLDNTVVNVALPSIQRDLHASLSSLEWTVNAYTLTLAVLMITSGRLGDIFGRRRLFLIGVTTFGISSLVIGFSPDDSVLIAFRAVQGIGAACMMPASLAIITQSFPPHERGTAIGTWAGVSALALAIGPVLGGFLTQDVSWRAIFFINPPIAVIAVAVTLFAAHESRDETVGRRVDYAGIGLLTIGLTALVLSLIEGNSWHWGSGRIVALWAVAVVAMIGFLVVEARVRAPMLDLGFFRDRTSAGVNLVGFIVSFALFAQFFFLTLYMQNVMHLSPLATGVRFLPTTVVLVVLGPVSGRLTDRIGPRPLMTAGTLIVAISIYIESRITVHSGYLRLLPGFVLMGIGMGLVMSPMTTAAMNAVDRSKAGAASGVLSMSRMVGSTFGVAVMGAIVTTVGRSKINQSLPHLPAAQRNRIVSALGSGSLPAGHHSSPQIFAAVERAFVSALGSGFTIGAAVTLIATVVAWLLIERKAVAPTPDAEAAPTPDAEAAPAASVGEAVATEPRVTTERPLSG
jgi:EmrB/QacA subfamily drug resistance transporter